MAAKPPEKNVVIANIPWATPALLGNIATPIAPIPTMISKAGAILPPSVLWTKYAETAVVPPMMNTVVLNIVADGCNTTLFTHFNGFVGSIEGQEPLMSLRVFFE